MNCALQILTLRQEEILTVVAKACCNAEVGQLLNLSPNAIKTLIATILERLQVSNRTEASVLFRSVQ